MSQNSLPLFRCSVCVCGCVCVWGGGGLRPRTDGVGCFSIVKIMTTIFQQLTLYFNFSQYSIILAGEMMRNISYIIFHT